MKIVTNKVRFSYLAWSQPKKNELSGKDEYSTELLIPKSDESGIAAIKAAMKAALDKKFPGGKYPPNLRNPLRDGDSEVKQDGSPLGSQYAGHYFIRTKSNEAPGVVDAQGQPIMIASDFVSGDYGRASITAFAYQQAGNSGVSFYLNNLQKLASGEPLGGKTSAADDFGVAKPASDNNIPF
jgi:hypothetical protein